MRRSRLVVVALVAVVALVWVGLRTTLLSGVGTEPAKRSEGIATLREVEGVVEWKERSRRFQPVEAPVQVDAGTTVRTSGGALAEIEYFDGSISRIGPNTTYEIIELEDAPGRTVIVGKIRLGETFHDVKELTGSGSRFEIQESNAIAAVRGTRFAARCLPPLPCGIAVVEGVVEVTPSSGGAVSVEAGHRVTIDDEGLLGEVTEVSPEDPWLNRNRDLDEDAAP